MIILTSSKVSIQISEQSVPRIPGWFGQVTVIAHYLGHLGVLADISERVRFTRRRFGHYDLIDFVVVLLGYAISGERTLEAFYECVHPFAASFMALFGRERLPHRSTLSRFRGSPSIKRRLRHCARRFLKTCALDRWRRRKKPGDCGIDRGTAGSSSTWMAPGKLPANVLCPVHPIFHRHSVGWMRSVRRATSGASGERR